MIITLTGPSCAGKSHLEKMLKARGFETAISTTTRKMREGEVGGEAYHFVDDDTFSVMRSTLSFVESVEFNGNHYGVSRKEFDRLLAAGKPIVIVCEPNGQKQIAQYCEDHQISLYAVFVDNPTEVIADRFLRRFYAENWEFAGESASGKSLSIYASRLADMMTTERAWAAEAYGNDGRYDRIVFTFDESNAGMVADSIAAGCVSGATT